MTVIRPIQGKEVMTMATSNKTVQGKDEVTTILDALDEYFDSEAEWAEEMDHKLRHLKPLIESKCDDYLNAKFEQLCEEFASRPELGEEGEDGR
jgi:hypothetical protein